jgi:hypothetical protein
MMLTYKQPVQTTNIGSALGRTAAKVRDVLISLLTQSSVISPASIVNGGTINHSVGLFTGTVVLFTPHASPQELDGCPASLACHR